MHSPRVHQFSHPTLFGAATVGLILIFANAQQVAGQQAAEHGAGQKAPEVQTISEDQLKQQFAGKTFFLRGGYFDNDLHFDQRGQYAGNSPKASYTLSLIEIDKVQLAKHKIELEGIRYGLHFLGAAPTEDPMQAADKVRITPKKKHVKIVIDRAMVTAPKKKKSKSGGKNGTPPPTDSASAVNPDITTSVTKAQANEQLEQALDRVFSRGMDERMIASLPDFWQLYYQAAAKKSRPNDPSILRQSDVDQKARLLTTFEPPSNDFAQNAGVAGIAQYRVVVAPDGKPTEIAVGRPIGFGLDENAVDSIRKASFQPAMKDGKPVPVMVDLIVQFRIFSKKTGSLESAAASLTEPEAAPLPGPYTANQPVAKQQ